jgi:hypothetical protein
MSTAIEPVELQPAATPAAEPEQTEHVEQPTAFGRLRWWFEESPIAFTASMAAGLVVVGIAFLIFMKPLRDVRSMVSVALQAVQADSTAPDTQQADSAMEFQQLSAAAAKAEQEEKVELPELPKAETTLKPKELLGNQADSEKQLKETEAALEQAGDMLRKLLEANQNRGEGTGKVDGASGRGTGQIDPNSTPGRQARWIITYPTLPQSDYEKMLDAFRIELAFLQVDRRTMQYLQNLSGVGKKYSGDADREDRMFWYWMGQNRLKEADDAILRKHGLEPSSDVVHLYPKELEKKLADMERDYLKKQFKQANVDKVAQTNFKIFPGGPGGWHLEVTGMVLK